MKINVTQTDIKQGVKLNGNKCAIARAVKRATNAKSVHVNGFYIEVNGKTYSSPEEVFDFVVSFDRFEKVKPFSFDLPLKKRTKKTTKKTSTITKVVKHDLVPVLV